MRRLRSRPALPVVAGLLLACGAASCGGRPLVLAGRLDEAPPRGLLDAEALAALQPPAPWRFDGAEERQAWTLRGLKDAGAGEEDAGWRLATEARLARLVRRVELPAAAVAAVTLRAEGLARGRARLFWSGRKARFNRARSVVARAAGGGEAALRFPVGGHPEWRGDVGSLRFDLPARPGGEIVVAEVELEPAAAPLAPLLDQPWSIPLGDETRTAFVVPPGGALERRLAVDPAARELRLAFGLLPGQECALEAVLTAEAGGETRALLQQRLSPPQDERWREEIVDVSALAGEEAVFALRAESGEACARPLAALAAAVPELLRPAPAEESRPPNVVLVSIDTLRADRLGLYGYERPTSPRLDALSRRAVVFDDAVAPAPWTLPSHVSMLTGMTALAHGVNTRTPAGSALVFLAELLRSRGYTTAAWTGGSWLAPRYGFVQGFDRYVAWTAADDWEGELAAHAAAAAGWLEDAAEPFLLFFHTFETHAPYQPREPWYSRWADAAGGGDEPAAAIYDRLLPPLEEEGFALRKELALGRDGSAPALGASPAELARLSAAYDSGVAYADRQLGRLLEALESRGLDERTIVLVTSDHGESLGEGGLVSHGHLHDSNLLVPWIMALPGGEAAGRRVETQVSLVDLVPTLLEIAGLPVPAGLDGISLVPWIRRQAGDPGRLAASYAGSSNLGLALRAGGRRKYLRNDAPWPPLAGGEALYDLAGEAETPLPLAAAGADLARFRDEAARLLASGAGLHLRLWNGEGDPLLVTLRGPCVHPLTVKQVAGRSGAISWVRRQEAALRAGPGETVELRFDSPGSPCLTAEVAIAGAATPLTAAADPTLAPEQLFGLVRGEWSDLEPGGTPATGLRLWLEGALADRPADPAATDPALLKQLRALGYVE